VNVHYLYCSDGVDLIIDKTPRRSRRMGDMIAGAKAMARAVMAKLPAHRKWDDWSVYIYDDAGQIDVVPFLDALSPEELKTRTPRMPAPASRSSDRETGRGVVARDYSPSRRSVPMGRGTASRRVPVYH
jgi:hypothetical protein